MSCKVFPPGEGGDAERLVWQRPVSGSSDGEADRAARLERRLEEFERHCGEQIAQARDAGYREGQAAGRAQAAEEVRTMVERMARSVDDMADLRPRLRREAEGDVVRLALAIARRILHRELSMDPEALLGLVQAAWARLDTDEITRISVHPSQVNLIRRCLDERSSRGRIEIVADPAGGAGALVFETARGNLDASLENQLGEIERGLTDRLGRRA